MSTNLEFRFATCPLMSDGVMLSWKVTEPSILQAHLNAATFMRAIGGAWSLGGVSFVVIFYILFDVKYSISRHVCRDAGYMRVCVCGCFISVRAGCD